MDSLVDKIQGVSPDEATKTVGAPLREPAGKAQARVLGYIAVLATVYTLYFAREIFIPILLAVLLKLLLAPVTRVLQRLHMPDVLSAVVVVMILVTGIGGIVYAVQAPAAAWIERVPRELPRLSQKLKDVTRPLQKVQEATEKVEQVTQTAPSARTVVLKEPGLSDYVFTGTRSFLVALATVLLLLTILLATGDHFLRRVVEFLPRFSDKKQAVEVARLVERDISTYLATITAINIVVGVVAGSICWFVGLPDPFLWGVVSGVLNFIPYLGPFTTFTLLCYLGLTTFNTLGDALLAPAIFGGFTLIEGNLITPLLLSHRLQMNAVCVFVGLMVFAFLWGIPGMLLAVPLLAMLRIVCDHVEPLVPFGRFLGNGKPQEAAQALSQPQRAPQQGHRAPDQKQSAADQRSDNRPVHADVL